MNLLITTAFGSIWTFENPRIEPHAWGETATGFARQEGQLMPEFLTTRLDTAQSIAWVEDEAMAA